MAPAKRKQGKSQSGGRKSQKTKQTKDIDVPVDETFDAAGEHVSVPNTDAKADACLKMRLSTWTMTA